MKRGMKEWSVATHGDYAIETGKRLFGEIMDKEDLSPEEAFAGLQMGLCRISPVIAYCTHA